MFSARNLTGQAGRLPVVHGFFYGSKPSITSGKRVVALLSGIISKVVIVRGKSPDHIAAGSGLLGSIISPFLLPFSPPDWLSHHDFV